MNKRRRRIAKHRRAAQRRFRLHMNVLVGLQRKPVRVKPPAVRATPEELHASVVARDAALLAKALERSLTFDEGMSRKKRR